MLIYYPVFSDARELTSHFFRAAWYLPAVDGVSRRVVMPAAEGLTVGECPEAMAEPRPQAGSHIEVLNGPSEATLNGLLSEAEAVFLWKPVSEATRRRLAEGGAQLFDVATDDLAGTEYGTYCGALWKCTPERDQADVLRRSHEAFRRIAAATWAKGYDKAVVFGTGPSIDKAETFDFSSCFTHVCNTIVQDRDLIDHIDPDMISAGDVVSHFGVSAYAGRFRDDLRAVMRERDCAFLTTAQFGYLLWVHEPELRDRILLCDQGPAMPNFDLLSNWQLPGLDSVLNIHMLPTAATLFNEVFVLGCDGQNPDPSKNEDFWQHSARSQYHDLVDSGHRCHPTFAKHRERATWRRFQNSVKLSLDVGEAYFGKSFTSLAPSFTPGLAEREGAFG